MRNLLALFVAFFATVSFTLEKPEQYGQQPMPSRMHMLSTTIEPDLTALRDNLINLVKESTDPTKLHALLNMAHQQTKELFNPFAGFTAPQIYIKNPIVEGAVISNQIWAVRQENWNALNNQIWKTIIAGFKGMNPSEQQDFKKHYHEDLVLWLEKTLIPAIDNQLHKLEAGALPETRAQQPREPFKPMGLKGIEAPYDVTIAREINKPSVVELFNNYPDDVRESLLQKHGTQLLNQAVANGNIGFVHYLLNHGVKQHEGTLIPFVEEKIKVEKDPTRFQAVLEILKNNLATIEDAVDLFNNYPAEVREYLLQKHGVQLLHQAAVNGNIGFVRYLLHHGVKQHEDTIPLVEERIKVEKDPTRFETVLEILKDNLATIKK